MRILPAGVLLLEKLSELLGCPLQIGKGGLRDGVILDLLEGDRNRPLSALPLGRWRRRARSRVERRRSLYEGGGQDRRGPGRELVDHASGVLDMADIERLHDMRVATRRLRAALEIFGPCFPQQELKAALREVKALADALGERRDRDVTIARLEAIRGSLAAPDRPGIDT